MGVVAEKALAVGKSVGDVEVERAGSVLASWSGLKSIFVDTRRASLASLVSLMSRDDWVFAQPIPVFFEFFTFFSRLAFK